MLVEYYDENGIHLFQAHQDDEINHSYTETLIDENNHNLRNKWDGTEWVEDATPLEVKTILDPMYRLRLEEKVSYLKYRARAISMDKEGTPDYIVTQKELYEMKYQVALGNLTNPYLESLMLGEANEFYLSIGMSSETPLDDFKGLIIYMYETGLSHYNNFIYMIERCRTKIQTLIENEEWDNVRQAFVYSDNLTDASQAVTTMNNILTL